VMRPRFNRTLRRKEEFPLQAGFRSSVVATSLLPAAFLFVCSPAIFAVAAGLPGVPATSPVQSGVSLHDYQVRLRSLDQLVVSCQRAITPANCQSDQVGPDMQLSLPAGVRQIRFAWLRELLNEAAKNQAPSAKAAQSAAPLPVLERSASSGAKPGAPVAPAVSEQKPEFKPPTLTQQLEDARQRLAADSQTAAQTASQLASRQQAPPTSNATVAPAASSSRERQTLARILAAKEYHPAVVGPSLLQRLLERIGNWLDRILGVLHRAGFQAKWIGRAAEIGFAALLCVALVWFFIRLERQGRLGATAFGPGSLDSGSAAGSASARDWQLWLEDARLAASQGAWRDAIHLLYWASISHLESGGLWPADRARTPREYLALVSPDSAHRPGLLRLTRSFERTWYGGKPAAEVDFRNAERFAAELGAKSRDSKGAQ
jgi:hypothetical protein